MAFRFKKKVKTHSNPAMSPLQLVGSTALPDGSSGTAYAWTFLSTGGLRPYSSLTLQSGSLPAGVTLSSVALTGTPTAAGTSTFTIQLRDALGSTTSEQFRLVISATPVPLSIQNSTTAPQGVVGNSYSAIINSTGGTAPYSSLSLIGGSLPAGLSLSNTAITGTPSTTGTSTFTIQVRDTANSTARQSFALSVVSSGGSFAYFNNLAGLSETFYSNSLRASSLITSTTVGNQANFFTYVYGADPYATPQDAAKLLLPSSVLSLRGGEQIRFPIFKSTGTVTWAIDFWFGPEWVPVGDGGQIDLPSFSYKFFQVALDDTPSGDGKVSIEARLGFTDQNGENIPGTPATHFAATNHRHYMMSPEDGAIGEVTFTGTPGVVIQDKTQVVFGGKTYELQKPATITSGGTVTATCEAIKGFLGSSGNQPVLSTGTVLAPPTNVSSQCTIDSSGFRFGVSGCPIKSPITPTGSSAEAETSIFLTHGAWHRFVGHLRLGRPHTEFGAYETAASTTITTGTYHAFSQWWLSSNAGPLRVAYEVPIPAHFTNGLTRGSFCKYYIEVNTSSSHNKASGQVTFTGTNNVTFPKGGFINTATARWVTEEAATIAGGSATVTATATGQYQGPDGNCAQGTVFTVENPPAGIDATATAATAFTGGSFGFSGPMVAYFRNFAAAHNYTLPATPEDDTNWFVRPP